MFAHNLVELLDEGFEKEKEWLKKTRERSIGKPTMTWACQL
jgi:hypothetical protein